MYNQASFVYGLNDGVKWDVPCNLGTMGASFSGHGDILVERLSIIKPTIQGWDMICSLTNKVAAYRHK